MLGGKTGVIQTVLGSVKASELGYCQSHEHILIAPGVSGEKNPALVIDEPGRSKAELDAYRFSGGRAIVDAQPGGCGRMTRELCDISSDSGVHIVASTGFHKLEFYRTMHFLFECDAYAIAKWMVAELNEGMFTDGDESVEIPTNQTSARAGIIKAATDGCNFFRRGDNERIYKKLFAAAAAASTETGAPVMVHLEMGAGGEAVLEALLGWGVPPDLIILCHLDRTDSAEKRRYDMELAKSGTYLELDTIGRFKYRDDDSEAKYIAWLCAQGLEDRILIGLDTTRKRLASYGGDISLCYIINVFRMKLRQYGVTDEQFYKFVISNPATAFSRREVTNK